MVLLSVVSEAPSGLPALGQILTALLPKLSSHFERVDIALIPPLTLLPGGMDVVMVNGAEWHGKLIAHFQA